MQLEQILSDLESGKTFENENLKVQSLKIAD